MTTLMRSMKNVLASAACVVALHTAATAETLADALVGAYNHSGLLKQNRALLRAADEDVAQAASTLLPVIRWTADFQRTEGNSRQNNLFRIDQGSTDLILNLIAEWQIYDFGADAARVEAQKENVLATRAGLTSVEQNVLLAAVDAFFNVRRSIEVVALRQNNLRLLTEELRAARDRFEVGEVTRTDVALAESALAAARSGLAQAQGDLVSAREAYRNAVGRNPGNLVAPRGLPRVERNLKKARGVALRHNPLLAQAQRQVASAEFLIQAAEADMKPRITLDGALRGTDNFDGDGYSTTATVGIGATQTIYEGGRLSSSARRAMAVRDAQRNNLHQVRHNVEQAVGDAYADVLASTAQIEASDRQIVAARTAFRGVREEATLGARTTLDVLDAEQQLLDAQANRITAQANQFVAAYSLLAAQGLLTAERLKLPVQLYDPSAYYNLVKDGVAKRSKQGKQLDRVLKALQKN